MSQGEQREKTDRGRSQTEQLSALAAFDRALRRESHVLRDRPELTWQQLYNRLQWAGPPLAPNLSAALERRSRAGARPWIHRYTRLRESEALVRTLTGHAGRATACAVSPDGTWVVSAGDESVEIWDAGTGIARATLASGMGSCAVSPDGTWIVSAGSDRTLKIWDAATGT